MTRFKYHAFAVAASVSFASVIACSENRNTPTHVGPSMLPSVVSTSPESRGTLTLQDASGDPSISVSTRSAGSLGMDRNTLEIRLPAEWDTRNVRLERVRRYDVTNMWVLVNPPIVVTSAPHAANGNAVDITVQNEAFNSGGRFEGWLQREVGGSYEDVRISWEFPLR